MGKINDIDLNNWKNYSDISTDSLWIINKRDSSGNHKGDYHGNFVPQIPNQLLKRYTKKGDWVLDAFLGSGTTLIECQKLGRNGIGIDIDPEILSVATFVESSCSTFAVRPLFKTRDVCSAVSHVASQLSTYQFIAVS